MLNHVGVAAGHPDSLSKSCDDLTAKLEERLRQQREMRREMSRELNKELPETGDFRDMKERQCWGYSNLGKDGSFELFPSVIKTTVSNIAAGLFQHSRDHPQNDVQCLAAEAGL